MVCRVASQMSRHVPVVCNVCRCRTIWFRFGSICAVWIYHFVVVLHGLDTGIKLEYFWERTHGDILRHKMTKYLACYHKTDGAYLASQYFAHIWSRFIPQNPNGGCRPYKGPGDLKLFCFLKRTGGIVDDVQSGVMHNLALPSFSVQCAAVILALVHIHIWGGTQQGFAVMLKQILMINAHML